MSANPINNSAANRKYVLASVTMAAVLAATRPNILSKVYAATNTYDWTKQVDLDRLGGIYSSAARSANGTHLILGVDQGGEGSGQTSPLFISKDSGATWENVADEVDPGFQNNWSSVDVSNDGQTMVAASDFGWNIEESSFTDGRVVKSEDGGDTWENITPEGVENWRQIVVSGDGSKIAAIEQNQGNLHLTDDGGDNWTSTQIDENVVNLKSISISDNGGKILIGGENNANYYTDLFISEDDGDTWDTITPNAADQVNDVKSSISADGSHIVSTSTGWSDSEAASVYVSENDGDNWQNITPEIENSPFWKDVSLSDDESTIGLLDSQNNKMYVSNDLGANWTEEDPGQATEDSNNWVDLDLNEDGTKIVIAGEQNAYINDIATETSVTLDDAEGGKTITLTTPSGTTITCHSAVKESGLSANDAAYSYPLGLVDFCFSDADESNQISLVFVTDLTPSQVVARKYNPANGGTYATIDNASITETTYQSQHALLVTYTVVDNGALDTDSDIGEVADPVGLGVSDVTSPNTGISPE